MALIWLVGLIGFRVYGLGFRAKVDKVHRVYRSYRAYRVSRVSSSGLVDVWVCELKGSRSLPHPIYNKAP